MKRYLVGTVSAKIINQEIQQLSDELYKLLYAKIACIIRNSVNTTMSQLSQKQLRFLEHKEDTPEQQIIQQLKIMKPLNQAVKQLSLEQFLQNADGKGHLSKQQHKCIIQILTRIQFLEQKVEMLEGKRQILKRKRRKARQISREFQCRHKDCEKVYASETSLKLHNKLKHPFQ